MMQHRVLQVVFRGAQCRFADALIWCQPDGAWGVELAGVVELAGLIPNRSVSLAAQLEDGRWFTGPVMTLSFGEINISEGRLHLSGIGPLERTGDDLDSQSSGSDGREGLLQTAPTNQLRSFVSFSTDLRRRSAPGRACDSSACSKLRCLRPRRRGRARFARPRTIRQARSRSVATGGRRSPWSLQKPQRDQRGPPTKARTAGRDSSFVCSDRSREHPCPCSRICPRDQLKLALLNCDG